jgi:PKD repeat protein
MTSRVLFMVVVTAVLGASPVAGAAGGGSAKSVKSAHQDTIPTWLDTIAPVVQIQPREPFHKSIFHVTFAANKQATIWYRVVPPSNASKKEEAMEVYHEPFTVMEEGATRIYFQGEDLFGNKSRVDSMLYVFDTRQPVITVRPDPGRYRTRTIVSIEADKPCRFFWISSLLDTVGKSIPESLFVKDSLSGYISAVDRAGNRSTTRRLSWVVDSTTIRVELKPREGIFNTRKDISFTSNPPADVYYSFDPSAPVYQFGKFDKPVRLPYGNTIVRYFAKNKLGRESDVMKGTFVVDTVPPKLVFVQKSGVGFDTLVLTTKKPSAIRYTLDATFPSETSPLFTHPIVVARKGKCYLKAVAKDPAGNRSELFEWNYKYDKTPPVITLSRQPGIFSAPFSVFVKTSKPASVLYTLDGSPVNAHSTLYKDGIQISKEGSTTLRIMAVDEAENASAELQQEYVIDSKPPVVKARVEEDIRQNAFFITLVASEPATVYYEIDGAASPTQSSPLYAGKIAMHMGQVLRYFAVDKAGNKSNVRLMDDLKKPIVSVSPEGGVHNRPVKVTFHSQEQTTVFWRLTPDTVYNGFKDSLVLAKEGTYALEYYSESPNGLTSPTRRVEYVIDLTPPQTDVIVKKGNNDSVSVFFECSKNSTIYYTVDGSNPAYSATTRTAGNKFLTSRDRISIKRIGDVKLAFYAEDAAGNQSPIRVLDVFKPRAVPNVPAGRERIYDRVLSVALNTFDSKSVVYYARHNHVPTTDSAVFLLPLTLVASDTIMAFVVDAAGYRGQIDTFVYLIDLPPSPEFIALPAEVKQGIVVTFDGSKTIDYETPTNRLMFRWDFDGDGTFDTPWKNEPVVSRSFTAPGRYGVTLQVKDENSRTSTLKKDVLVQELCPLGMVSLARANGRTFCIDKYEWPNIAGEKPLTSVSWVQAKISCMDAGKRLCSAEEWSAACRGPSAKSGYPYGVKYEKGKCPSEGTGVYRSGKFGQCGDPAGAKDMVGNVWEWVEDKRGDYPVMMGGSFRFGDAADCGLSSEGGVGLRSNEVGFRCCK